MAQPTNVRVPPSKGYYDPNVTIEALSRILANPPAYLNPSQVMVNPLAQSIAQLGITSGQPGPLVGTAGAGAPTNVRVPPSEGTADFGAMAREFLSKIDPEALANTFGGVDPREAYSGNPLAVGSPEELGRNIGPPGMDAVAAALGAQPGGEPGLPVGRPGSMDRGTGFPTEMTAVTPENPILAETIQRLRDDPSYRDPGLPDFAGMRSAVEGMYPGEGPADLGWKKRVQLGLLGMGADLAQGGGGIGGLQAIMGAKAARQEAYSAQLGEYQKKKVETETKIAELTEAYTQEILETEQKRMGEDASNARSLAGVLDAKFTLAGNYLITSYIDPETGQTKMAKAGPIDEVQNQYVQSQIAKNYAEAGKIGRENKEAKIPKDLQRAKDYATLVAATDETGFAAALAGPAMLDVIADPNSEEVKQARAIALADDEEKQGSISQQYGSGAAFHGAQAGAGGPAANLALEAATANALIRIRLQKEEAKRAGAEE